MIKEGKERIIVTLDRDIANHLDTWVKVTGRLKSDFVNVALRLWFISRGDTFGEDQDKLMEEIKRSIRYDKSEK